jgi:hypothetical protein
MTILILLLRVYSVGEVSVLAHQIQKKPWNIGNKGYMKYLQGDVLILPTHCTWIGAEVCDPPKYDGLTDIDSFVK